MKLDRNINADGRGKYAILKLRVLSEYQRVHRKRDAGRLAIEGALATLEKAGILDWGTVGTESEFMLIRLKDRYAQNALSAYATTAALDGETEYAEEIQAMALRSGPHNPWCKKPD